VAKIFPDSKGVSSEYRPVSFRILTCTVKLSFGSRSGSAVALMTNRVYDFCNLLMFYWMTDSITPTQSPNRGGGTDRACHVSCVRHLGCNIFLKSQERKL
jgi:hypothetical protein